MPSLTLVNAFAEHLAEKVHDFQNDSFILALCAAANPPVVGNSVLADLTQIAYTNLGSRAVTVSSSSQTGGLFKAVIANKNLDATGSVATFRYVVLVNDTPTSPLDPIVGFWDIGSDVSLVNNQSLQITFDATNGTIRIRI